MQSKIDIAEFKKRLFKNTKITNPYIVGTPLAIFTMFFDSSDKKFCGRINNNSFVITTYSTFYPIPYKIEGEIYSETDSTTSVKYVIKPIWFQYLWIRIIPAIFTLFITFILVANSSLIFPVGILGSIFILMFMLNIYLGKRRLRKFEIDFKKTFGIT